MKLIFRSSETIKNNGKNKKKKIRKIGPWNKEKSMRKIDRKSQDPFNIA